jgi:hypothetical protein
VEKNNIAKVVLKNRAKVFVIVIEEQGVGLYVQTAVWYSFVITSIVIVDISTFIIQHDLMKFVMLASIVIVKSSLCVQ